MVLFLTVPAFGSQEEEKQPRSMKDGTANSAVRMIGLVVYTHEFRCNNANVTPVHQKNSGSVIFEKILMYSGFELE